MRGSELEKYRGKTAALGHLLCLLVVQAIWALTAGIKVAIAITAGAHDALLTISRKHRRVV